MQPPDDGRAVLELDGKRRNHLGDLLGVEAPENQDVLVRQRETELPEPVAVGHRARREHDCQPRWQLLRKDRRSRLGGPTADRLVEPVDDHGQTGVSRQRELQQVGVEEPQVADFGGERAAEPVRDEELLTQVLEEEVLAGSILQD